MKSICDKRGFQISFGWLFAIIAGAFILFLAIYATGKFVTMEEYELTTTTAKRMGILMNPLETSFESGTSSYMILPTRTRVYNGCDVSGLFGEQELSLSDESLGKWTLPGATISFQNKYIFSTNIVEGKKFYLFSKPFDYPFKVANLIFLSSSDDEYCFIDPPEEIEDELLQFQQENLKLGEECSNNTIKICFNSGPDCNMEVVYSDEEEGYGYVSKNGERLDFSGALVYGAIFSEKENYECQVKRLMKRLEQLSLLYYDKSRFISSRDCNSGLESELMALNNLANSFEVSSDFIGVNDIVNDLDRKNREVDCKLW